MAGSHRAKPSASSSRVSRRAIAIAVAVAVIPALVYLLHGAFTDGGSPAAKTSPTVQPIPAVTTPTASSPTSPPPTAVTHPPVSSPPVQPHLPKVSLDVPRRLLSKGLLNVGFDNTIEPKNGSFRAASTAEVARWGARGEPGSPAKDTVYIIGKSFTKGVSAFDTLPKIVKGAKIVIRTDSGDLTYTVSSVASQSATGLAEKPAFAAKVPGRLVVVGLLYKRSGALSGQAVVVTAEISGAVAR